MCFEKLLHNYVNYKIYDNSIDIMRKIVISLILVFNIYI